eukprot:NODE_10363_length_521_cov_24.344221_g9715_i0.p1 GENE.NODE_10363_length_521_cov_24.344221_g9715_i0~~NODE_10363_length_521_cov_24.344221_g9715_i0.p1  ORF type:complete len:122 (-),score=18.05 NODE_10363_length_521_cov_24.344221_g9715_i0:105-470(-)
MSTTKCCKCGLLIDGTKEEIIDALDSTWHSTCFSCHQCRKPIKPGKGCCVVIDGNPVHPDCAPRHVCSKCSQKIEGREIVVGDKRFHEGCWCCSQCSKVIQGGKYFEEEDGSPLCTTCGEA